MKDKWKCKNPIICKFSKPTGHQKTLHYLTETSKKQIFKNQNFKKHQGSKRDDENSRSTTWKRKRIA